MTQAIIQFPNSTPKHFTAPSSVFAAHHLDEVRATVRAAETAARAGQWVIGFLTYEAAPAFDAALRVRSPSRMPLAWFAAFDHAQATSPQAAPLAAAHWQLTSARADFCARVERIREEIAAGTTYQVNLTARLLSDDVTDPYALYASLTRAQGSGYHAFIDTGEFVIASASPELFFEKRGPRIRTKPMKGTRARGRFAEEDAQLANELAQSEKDRAENLMIVDLLRNDLGRVAKTGTVHVDSLYDVETFRTVQQMTSTITATLRADVALPDIFGALFPCGSVTGAPKVSTMRLITELEDTPREVYCGAIGIIEPGGENATFNVPIRTVWLERSTGTAVYGSGAGITYDSAANSEYDEVVAKAAVLTEAWPDFELLETMRIEHGRIVRLERHIARLLASAQYFGIPADEHTIREALRAAQGFGRVRLLVDQRGNARVEVSALPDTTLRTVAVAAKPVSARERFLFHKTTHRLVYEQQQRADVFDVVLWNEQGEITEFTRGNIVVELDGVLWTPPRPCGLLAGVFRAELLEAGTIHERVILLEELPAASAIFFINSLREWVPVSLV